MQDLHKVHTMIGMAIYDKYLGEKDRRALSLTKGDYVYRKNLGVRLGAGVGYLLLAGLYLAKQLFVDEADLFLLLSRQTVIRLFVGLIVVLIVYTVIGNLLFRREYDRAVRRNGLYERRVERLRRYDAEERTIGDE